MASAGLCYTVSGSSSIHLAAGSQSEIQDGVYTPVGTVPEWTTASKSIDNSSTFAVVSTDYLHNEREAIEELWTNAMATVARKLDENVAPGAGRLVTVDRELIKQKLLVSERIHTQVYRTANPVSVEPVLDGVEDNSDYLEWYRCFVGLDFNNSFYDWAKVEFDERLVEDRVRQTALIAFSGFSLLVVLFGFLKFNHRTQGLYTGRLQSIAIFAAIAVILVALALSYSIAWL